MLLTAGMILSTGVGTIVNSDVIAKEKKKKGGKKAKLPKNFDQLGLSDDQVKKIAALMPEALGSLNKEISAARKAAGNDADKKKAVRKQFNKKLKPLVAEWTKKASAILTKDQKTKLAEASKKKGKGNKKKKK